MRENIIVLDFGGQYNQLIARRVRECNVYCEVHPYTIELDELKEMAPSGIILTGGPNYPRWNCPQKNRPQWRKFRRVRRTTRRGSHNKRSFACYSSSRPPFRSFSFTFRWCNYQSIPECELPVFPYLRIPMSSRKANRSDR